MRFSKDKSGELLESVRLEMVMNPSVTIFGLQDALREKYQRVFDKNYIAKLKNKIHRERARRVSKSIEYEVASLEDTCKELKRPLWLIIEDEYAPVSTKISAIKAIFAISKLLLDVMLSAGIFKHQAGLVKKELHLSEKDKELIDRALGYVVGRSANKLIAE